ncbi:MAG: hypothetical protein K0Q43_4802 [Ramlibacter sp.]|jgi:hypothetical protein|nr:hypothetical protein [Ramlibacter sp.]
MAEPALQHERTDPLFEVRPGGEFCRWCNGPWFGEVAFCPYCGRASTSGPEPRPSTVAPEAAAGWKSRVMPVVAGALIGLVLVIAGELAIRSGVWQALKAVVQGP